MPQYIRLSLKFKNTFNLVILALLTNTAFASNVSQKSSIIITTDDSKICIYETTVIRLSTTKLGFQYHLRNNNTNTFVSNIIIGDGKKAKFDPISPSQNTTYTVIAKHISNSLSIDLIPSIGIEVLPLPNTSLLITPTHNSLCVGDNIGITIENSESDVNYQIEGGVNINESSFLGNGSDLLIDKFEPFRSATYHINAIREGCQSKVILKNKFNLAMRLPPETQVYLFSDKKIICKGEEVQISLSPSDHTANYQLLDGKTHIGEEVKGNGGFINFGIINPTASTTYSVQAKGHNCIDPVRVDFTLKVDVHPSASTSKKLTSNKNEVCEGEALTISVNKSQHNVSYQLNNGIDFLDGQIIGNGEKISFPEIYPKDKTSYFVYARDLLCSEKLKLDDQIDFNLLIKKDFPIESFATPKEICLGETFDIELPITQNNITYHLYDKNTSVKHIKSDGSPIVFENILADIDSEYEILIDECSDKLVAANPKLEIHSTPHVNVIITDENIGTDGKANVIINGGKAPFTYVFENYKTIVSNERFIDINEMKAGDYKLAVIDANSCKSTDVGHEFKVNFSNPKEYAVKGILTPNGDGRNDSWTISYKPEWDTPEVSIFNIYGQIVFHSLNYQNDWKGTFNDSQLPNGSYFYLIDFHRNKMSPIKGILSILGRY